MYGATVPPNMNYVSSYSARPRNRYLLIRTTTTGNLEDDVAVAGFMTLTVRPIACVVMVCRMFNSELTVLACYGSL